MTDLGALGMRAGRDRRPTSSPRAPTLDEVVVDDGVVGYVTALVRATREHASVTLGRQPARRPSACCVASKARAMLAGRDFVTPDDVKAMAPACLRHRILLRPEVEIEGMDVDTVLADVLGSVPGAAVTPPMRLPRRRALYVTPKAAALLAAGALPAVLLPGWWAYVVGVELGVGRAAGSSCTTARSAVRPDELESRARAAGEALHRRAEPGRRCASRTRSARTARTSRCARRRPPALRRRARARRR